MPAFIASFAFFSELELSNKSAIWKFDLHPGDTITIQGEPGITLPDKWVLTSSSGYLVIDGKTATYPADSNAPDNTPEELRYVKVMPGQNSPVTVGALTLKNP